jgi:aquaporin Z
VTETSTRPPAREARPAPAEPRPWAPLAAEAVGTFALVLVGTGAIAGAEELGWFDLAGISLAFGAVVALVILAFGKVSGAHINPAVTIGFASAGRFERRRVLPYVAAQLAGALAASALVARVFPTSERLGSTFPVAGWWPSFLIEVALTFVLMLVILRASSRPGARLVGVALAVGGTVMAGAWLAGPHTGASMNPARSLGPALVSGGLAPLPLYLVAPLVGALLAVPACRLTGSPACCPGRGGCA